MKMTIESTGRLIELGVADSAHVTPAELWQGTTEIDGVPVRVIAIVPVVTPLLTPMSPMQGEFDAERDVTVEPWPEVQDFPAWIGL